MKKLVLMLVVIVTVVAACSKSKDAARNCNYDPCYFQVSSSEVAKVERYLDSVNITDAVKHCSGLYYKVLVAGAGDSVTVCSYITINYKGQLADGTVFDETTGSPRSWYLGQLIPGWVNGLPMIRKGGKVQLFVPPSLAYGSNGSGVIPGNAVLVFEIELVDVNQ